MCKLFLRIKNNNFFKTKCVENQVIMRKSNQFTHLNVKNSKKKLIKTHINDTFFMQHVYKKNLKFEKLKTYRTI